MSDTLLKDALRQAPRATPESIQQQLSRTSSSSSSESSSTGSRKRGGKLAIAPGFRTSFDPFRKAGMRPRIVAPVQPDPPAPPVATDTPADGVPGYVYPAVGLGLVALGFLASRLR